MDSFWASRLQDYARMFKAFQNEMPSDLSGEQLMNLWYHFHTITCDCEGCRSETDCTIHIDVPSWDEE